MHTVNTMTTTGIRVLCGFVALALIASFFWLRQTPKPVSIPESREETVSPEAIPSPTNTEVKVQAGGDSIIVMMPEADQFLNSPLTIRGQARGRWFFEGEFPIKLVSADGTIIARAPAKATEVWMTSEFVAFECEIEFERPLSPTGSLVFESPNQKTGEIDERFEIPVRFTEP